MGSVLKFVPVSERICLLRIKSKFNNISILNAYAPTEQADDEAKDSFYKDLETAFDQIPDYDTKIVIGDFNAKVGREEAYQPTIGLFSKHPVSNDNGLRLISFASSKSMVIKSTMFPHKAIHLGTWKSHDGRTVNQIDHVLIDERHKSMVQDVRSYRGADCDSDHYLVGVKVKAKINATNFKQPIREPMINTDSLQDNTTCRAFRQKRKKWWNDNCETAIERKRKYKVLAEQDNRWEEKHREARRDFRRLVRRAKRDHLAGILKHMETLIRSNESRKFYQEVRTAKKAYQPATQLLEDEEGNLVSDPEKQKTMWRQYFQQLLNCPPVTNENPVNTEDCRVDHDPHKEPPDFEEVRRAIMRLKNHKSPGIDNIAGELWKYGGGAMQSRLYELIRRIWEEEQQPMEWNVGIICPIHKKGCRKKCGNYRGIALLPTAYKVLSYIILARLEPYAEQILGDYQCGFRRNRSTVDQMFLLKQIMEKRWEYAQSVHCLFVDFAKAYDSIDRETLYHILTSYQVPKKLVRMIKIATGTSRMRVRAGGGLTDEFEVVTGLKQGDALSPVLFNLALEHIIRKVLLIDGGVELNGKHKIVGYADDLAILGQSEREVVKMTEKLEEEGKGVGLRISHEKTEYLHMKRYKDRSTKRKDLHVNGITYKGVDKFKYLGCTITDTNRREDEIDIRIVNALRCTAALHKVLVSKLLSRSTKIRIYKTVIRPILMYGCDDRMA